MEDNTKKPVIYGSPVITPMDIARNGGIMEDVYGSMEEYWEEQDERVRLKRAEQKITE